MLCTHQVLGISSQRCAPCPANALVLGFCRPSNISMRETCVLHTPLRNIDVLCRCSVRKVNFIGYAEQQCFLSRLWSSENSEYSQMDSASSASNSYFHKEFVPFYDQMVGECFGGVNATDVQRYSAMMLQLLNSTAKNTLVVVDLGCGSGRAVLAMLQRMSALKESLPCKVHIFGIDNSPAMLKAAEAKCAAFLHQQQTLNSCIKLTWVCSSFQDWSLPRTCKADFIVVAAGGLHHVTDTAELKLSLEIMSQQLSEQGVCVISYLPWDMLYRQDGSSSAQDAVAAPQPLTVSDTGGSSQTAAGKHTLMTEEFRVTHYKRSLVGRHVERQQDGSCVLHEYFKLSKLMDDDVGQVEWCIEEGWALRQLEEAELLQLAEAAGLVPCPAEITDPDRCLRKHGTCFVVLKHKL